MRSPFEPDASSRTAPSDSTEPGPHYCGSPAPAAARHAQNGGVHDGGARGSPPTPSARGRLRTATATYFIHDATDRQSKILVRSTSRDSAHARRRPAHPLRASYHDLDGRFGLREPRPKASSSRRIVSRLRARTRTRQLSDAGGFAQLDDEQDRQHRANRNALITIAVSVSTAIGAFLLRLVPGGGRP